MNKHNSHEERSETKDIVGVECPVCNTLCYPKGKSCMHYAGYFNVTDNSWKFVDNMSHFVRILEQEYDHICYRIRRLEVLLNDENLSNSKQKKYKTELNALSKIPKGKYEEYLNYRITKTLGDYVLFAAFPNVLVDKSSYANPDMMFFDYSYKDEDEILNELELDLNKIKYYNFLIGKEQFLREFKSSFDKIVSLESFLEYCDGIDKRASKFSARNYWFGNSEIECGEDPLPIWYEVLPEK